MSCHKGSNWHYFGSVCHLPAVSFGDQVAQKTMSNKRDKPKKTKNKVEFSENLQPGKSFSKSSGFLRICLHVNKSPKCREKNQVSRKYPHTWAHDLSCSIYRTKEVYNRLFGGNKSLKRDSSFSKDQESLRSRSGINSTTSNHFWL